MENVCYAEVWPLTFVNSTCGAKVAWGQRTFARVGFVAGNFLFRFQGYFLAQKSW